MKNNKKNIVSFLLIALSFFQFSLYSVYAAEYQKGNTAVDKRYSPKTAMFSKAEIQKDSICYNATAQSARIFFYIDMIKDIYDDICSTNDLITCDKSKQPIPDLLDAISAIERASSAFQLYVIRTSCPKFLPDLQGDK